MDEVQEKFEHAVMVQFLDWYNQENGSNFKIHSRGESPDFFIADGQREIGVEISSAYYDSGHAQFLWHPPRGVTNTPSTWSGINFDDALIKNIFDRINSKSLKAYAENSILLIYVRPGLTSYEDLLELVSNQNPTLKTPFLSVFIVGTFPMSGSSNGGDRVFCVTSRDS